MDALILTRFYLLQLKFLQPEPDRWRSAVRNILADHTLLTKGAHPQLPIAVRIATDVARYA